MVVETIDGPALKLLDPTGLEERFLTYILLLVKSSGLPGEAKCPVRLFRERIEIGGAYPAS